MRGVTHSLLLDIRYHLVTSIFIYDERKIQTPAFCMTHWSLHINLEIKSVVFEQNFDLTLFRSLFSESGPGVTICVSLKHNDGVQSPFTCCV